MLISGSMFAVYQIIDGDNAIRTKAILDEESNFLIRKINWTLTGSNLDIIDPSPGSPGPVLEFDNPDLPPNDFKFEFDPSSKSITLNGVLLNSSSVSVEAVEFDYDDPQLNITFTLNGREFQTVKLIR